jgi:hypothetical protein
MRSQPLLRHEKASLCLRELRILRGAKRGNHSVSAISLMFIRVGRGTFDSLPRGATVYAFTIRQNSLNSSGGSGLSNARLVSKMPASCFVGSTYQLVPRPPFQP